MKIFGIVAGSILIVNGIWLCLTSNLNLGNILTFLLGAFFLVWGVFSVKISEITQKGLLKFIKCGVILLLCAECFLVGAIAIYGQADNVDYSEDAVIVLGAGLRGDKLTLPLKLRLDKAVDYSRKNSDAIIVVSGGQGLQETVTEAYAMEKYLVEQGVDGDRIIKEEMATSTNENMMFSKMLLDEHFDKPYKTVIITNNFHILRSVSIARTSGLDDVYHMHAEIQWYNLVSCYLRESLALLKMWIIG